MTNITLRAYIKEVESLIEQGFYDQAIAHCKHLLGIFPKNVDVYRILGKAHLESQRYGDAADIFQRVLSSIPDDFISHVGMSIIREDEGNLGEAIWHMDRAFESQPANSAIQAELKRLLGRRDGVEPTKINLSRGALARMYMKGGLVQQAIAELRTALAEDPQRLDLQSLLARAYYKANQKVAAAEICSNLLDKRPYSYDANQILSELLAESNRANDAQEYIKRIHSLNPYTAFLSGGINSPEQVSENAVIVEKLDYQTDTSLPDRTEQPSWATSLGIQIETDKFDATDLSTERQDDKLEVNTEGTIEKIKKTLDDESDEKLNEISIIESRGEQMPDSDKLPEWMKDAGWEQSSDENQEEDQSTGYQSTNETEDIAPADIPEWLKSIAPQNIPDTNTLEEDTGETRLDEDTSWLEEIPPGPTDSISAWLKELNGDKPESVSTSSDESQDEEIPGWLQEMREKSGIEGKPINAESISPELPESEPIESNGSPDADMEDADELPEWLQEIETHPAPTQDLPEWLMDESEKSKSSENSEKYSEADVIPSWLTLDEDKSIVNQPGYDKEAIPPLTIPEINISEEDTKPVRLLSEKEINNTEFQPVSQEDTEAAYAWLESLANKPVTDEDYFVETDDHPEFPQEQVTTEEEIAYVSEEVHDEIDVSEDDLEQIQITNEDLLEPLIDQTTLEDSQSSSTLRDNMESLEGAESEIPQEYLHENEKTDVLIDRTDTDYVESDTTTTASPININTAGLNELEKVPGIGFILAQEIISHRELNGPFKSPEDLKNIHAISPDLLDELGGKLSYQYDEASGLIDVQTSTFQDTIIKSRELLERGDTQGANAIYRQIIESNENLSELISELEDLLSKNPLDVDLWISLGDTYMRSESLQQALDAYSKAEKILI